MKKSHAWWDNLTEDQQKEQVINDLSLEEIEKRAQERFQPITQGLIEANNKLYFADLNYDFIMLTVKENIFSLAREIGKF